MGTSASQPSIFILSDYVKGIYGKLLDYTIHFGNVPEGEEPETYLNNIIDYAFSHNVSSMIKMYYKETVAGHNEFHMYILSLLKKGISKTNKN